MPECISNYIHYKMWDEIAYPFPNFNGSTVEVWEWISNTISHSSGEKSDYNIFIYLMFYVIKCFFCCCCFFTQPMFTSEVTVHSSWGHVFTNVPDIRTVSVCTEAYNHLGKIDRVIYIYIYTSNGSWRQGIKGEMTCTVYVALVWNIIYWIMMLITLFTE